ncbi:MAG: hypothetical protein KIT31_33080 [Deltaproteobacteria bacterium]|nr:hypothetical protein [Deltaproteobacteria bacterium]
MGSDPDVLVVGSGASAVNAAWPLVAAGLRVRMLDVGVRDERYGNLVPDGPFEEVRRTDPQQHRYLLGDRFEGIGFEHMGAGAQLTPPRQWVTRDADRLQPLASASFFPLQSLAEGGLANAWGAGAPAFCAADLAGYPIAHADLAPHYEAVAARIGISGARDDLWPFLGPLDAMQPAVACDGNAGAILRRYARGPDRLHRDGLYLGAPRLAMLSRPLGDRQPTRYWDMDFWSDAGRSVYRPRWTVDDLRRSPRFAFVPRRLVVAFADGPDGVTVTARDLDAGTVETHRARRLVIGAGTLATTRIVLRSLGAHGTRVPLVCNPHTYAAMLNLGRLGDAGDEPRHSLAQLCVVHAPRGPAAPFTVGHYYSYRSLLLFRLLKGSPLPMRHGLEVLRLLSPSLGVLILQHADRPTPAKYCELRAGGAGGDDDVLHVEYALSREEQARIDAVEADIVRGLRRLRCLRLQTVRPGHAASTHFAGTLPMSRRDAPLTTAPDGRLHGTRHVYVVDGSVFPDLPSKGLTFTMMANADRIATLLARSLGALQSAHT